MRVALPGGSFAAALSALGPKATLAVVLLICGAAAARAGTSKLTDIPSSSVPPAVMERFHAEMLDRGSTAYQSCGKDMYTEYKAPHWNRFDYDVSDEVDRMNGVTRKTTYSVTYDFQRMYNSLATTWNPWIRSGNDAFTTTVTTTHGKDEYSPTDNCEPPNHIPPG